MTLLESIGNTMHRILDPISIPLMAVYFIVLAIILIYGLHRYWLVLLFHRYGRNALDGGDRIDLENDATHWPSVTVQLPMFNEYAVAQRVIEAVCTIDYPRDRLQIQVLDDSTDESAGITREAAERMQAAGHDVQYLHRTHRQGFKAGALEDGLKEATGELIAVFDADFIPNPDILKRTVLHFEDQEVGMVQVRWGHLNRDDSMLTRSQAIFLDGHFVIEHTARERSGRWFNFNGTAGVWRRTCIEDAGGWQHDTLTEDVDLSYRAQLKGWRFVYDPSLECPAELPPCVSAFKTQQHRWTKGSVQTGLKLLPMIFRSSAPLATKIEAWFHLTSPIVYVCIVLLSLLFFPAFFVNIYPMENGTWLGLLFGVTLFAIATASGATFYLASQWAQKRSLLGTFMQLPILMAVGIGISVNNSRGVIEALLGKKSPFVRTPKFNGKKSSSLDPLGRRRKRGLPPGTIELSLGALMLFCIVLAWGTGGGMVSIPFLILFAVGYLTIGVGTVYDAVVARA